MNIRNAMSRVLHPGEDEPAPDALTLIKSDHAEVEGLFGKALADDTTPSELRTLAATICTLLTVHADMEEQFFYPELRRKGGKDEKDTVLEANEEHGMAKDMIAKIQSLRAGDETLEAKVTVLKEMIMHHVKEEESTIFKEARATLGGERLQALGEEMQAFKKRALGAKQRGTARAPHRRRSRRARPRARGRKRRAGARTNGRATTAAKKSSARKKTRGR